MKLFVFIIAFFVLSCSQVPQKNVWFNMDTIIEITLFANPNAKISTAEMFDKIQNFLQNWDERFSPSAENSEILKINNRETDTVNISDDLYEMLKISILYSQKTDGLFDITVKPLKDFWNIAGDGDFLPDPEDPLIADTLAKILQRVDYRNISLLDNPKRAVLANTKTQIDLGAIAKGFAIGRLADILKNYGFSNFIINIGGDIFVSGNKERGKPIVVGVRHPRQRSDLLKIFSVGGENRQSAAIFTSGDYERYRVAPSGARVHHIFDPQTGFPATANVSLTIIGDCPVIADILSTAFFSLSADEIRKRIKDFDGYGFILVDKNGEVEE
ncbi:MAG: FAD:protein FMN transferase [Chitinivibrionia bacterium]|nr:FAD:protein FMN transferase [Chitinivibrionia bacterium]